MCDVKVDKLQTQLRLQGQHDVVGFDVSVCDLVFVQESDGLEQLGRYLQYLF